MNFVIWGVGWRGKRIFNCIEQNKVMAFIESNPALVGTCYKNKIIISFECYLEKYSECFIIISPSVADSIISLLEQNNVKRYFYLSRCPRELPYINGLLPFDEILSGIDIDKLAILGLNLFGLLLYDYLRSIGKNNVVFIKIKEETELADIMEGIYGYKFVSLIEAEKCYEHILIVDRTWGEGLYGKVSKGIKFYRFSNLKRYRYKSLEKFKNIHKNKRCFVVATGPSLRISDLDRLYQNNEICLSMNNIYKGFLSTKWRPDYYIAEDPIMLSAYKDDLINMRLPYKFLSDLFVEYWKTCIDNNIYLYHELIEMYGANGPSFSADVSKEVFHGRTVLYIALQFAVYMGFTDIYIIGADSEYKGDGRADINHFVKDYDNKSQAPAILQTDEMFIAYGIAKRYADTHGIHIYNATRGGKLEVFERVNFDSLFKK